MIYLLDEKYVESSHSILMKSIIEHYTKTDIAIIEIHPKITISGIINLLHSLISLVIPNDIIFCPWAVDANVRIDQLFEELSERCFVVSAAGNSGMPIDNYSPARVYNVYTVGSLNKFGVRASHSNYSTSKEIIWVPGTNYFIGNKFESGTSIASALYTAFLAEAINKQDMSYIDEMIFKLKSINLSEVTI